MFPQKTKLVIGAVAMTTALAGCSDMYLDRRETISLSAGDALYTNAAVHMVDPWPAASANRDIPFDGERMRAAQERYRQNRVIPPANAMTSSTRYDQPAPLVMPAAK